MKSANVGDSHVSTFGSLRLCMDYDIMIRNRFGEEGKISDGLLNIMWKKIILSLIFCFLLSTVCGCGNTEQASGTKDVVVSLIPDSTYKPESLEDMEKEDTAKEEAEEPAEELSEVTLYLPDENAEYLVPAIVKAVKTPEGLIAALVEQGALPKGTEINYFTLKDNGQYISLEDEVASMSDKLTAEIDLSDPFMEEVQHTGTAGEAMLMGSVVNTMSENFHLQTIMVSANDEVIETGHCIYDEPQKFYKELVEQ